MFEAGIVKVDAILSYAAKSILEAELIALPDPGESEHYRAGSHMFRSLVGENDNRSALFVPLVSGKSATENVRLFCLAQNAREEANKANKAKSAFLAPVNHDIRAPVNAVIGKSGLLIDTDPDEEQYGCARAIRGTGEAPLEIISELRDFSKIEAGQLDIEEHPFELRDCIESALDLAEGRAAVGQRDVANVVEGDLPMVLSADLTRLRQILLNLLGNDLKFTDAGEVILTISPAPAKKGGVALSISVKDGGIGLSKDGMRRLFQSLSEAGRSAPCHFGGTDFGFAISKRLAELMGETMWATSDGPGMGATFQFTLRAKPAEQPLPKVHDLIRQQSELVGEPILVVDDNLADLKILSLQTRKWGAETAALSTPLGAINALTQSDDFDLAILEIRMPEMDGLELAKKTRLQERKFPMVLFRSIGVRDVEDSLFAANLAKPLRQSQLYDALIKVLAPKAPRPPVDHRDDSQFQAGAREMCLAAGLDGHIAKPILGDRLIEALLDVPPNIKDMS